ncbi:DUF1801 domain-containing protein [Rhodobacteraceae bacterium N5(2021)]|uniref:DUF1801 domain-containing protein n=1 Tax=Gymnodinialimonas phycosphaerae TaxID=2841589 RepID=A0A975TRE6_9RHOB|nr:DUF1801 domain-containing protein [Gymnodinialimonas phycosphaerae]MBY4893420.1 DUF1801 domain-containing protein [Gymnodinialimonas phycosphaerae]
MSQAHNKTQATDADVTAFLEAVEHPTRRADGLALDALFQRVSGFKPRMWGPSLVGYGRYDYTYKSGREGSFLATGFSPRKANLSIHIMPGYADYGEMLGRLGKHKKAVSCLYVNKLADIDLDVLEMIIRAGLRDLDAIWPVHPD